MDTNEIVDKSYVLALKHAIDHLEINFLAGVDNSTTLEEFKKWFKEKGGKDIQLTPEEERRENEL